jgi:hypothetical protein
MCRQGMTEVLTERRTLCAKNMTEGDKPQASRLDVLALQDLTSVSGCYVITTRHMASLDVRISGSFSRY